MEDCIEEPIMYFYGEGLGAESLVGNDGKVTEETKSNNSKPSAPKMFFFGQPGCLQNSPVKPLTSLTNKEEPPIKKTFSLVDYETDSSSNSNNQTEKRDGPEKESDKKIVESENNVKESVSAEEEDDLLDRITKALESDEETKIKVNETKNVTSDRPFSNVQKTSFKTASLNEEQANLNHKSNDTTVRTTSNIDNDNKESILPAQENVNINLKEDIDESMSNKKNEQVNKEKKEKANKDECKIKDNTQITSQVHETNEIEQVSEIIISTAKDKVSNLKNESLTTSIKHDNLTEISIPKHETPANIQKIEDNIKNILETSQQIIAKFPSIDNSTMDVTIESPTPDTSINIDSVPVEAVELNRKLVEDVEKDTPNSTNGQECPSTETEIHEDTKIAENTIVDEDLFESESSIKDDEKSEITEEAIIIESSTNQEKPSVEVKEEESSNKSLKEVIPNDCLTNKETSFEIEDKEIIINYPEEEVVNKSSSNVEISLKGIEEQEITVEIPVEVEIKESMAIKSKQESPSKEIKEEEKNAETSEKVAINEESSNQEISLKELNMDKCVEIPKEMTIDESSSKLETYEESTSKTPERETVGETSSNQEVSSKKIEEEDGNDETSVKIKLNESLMIESKQESSSEEKSIVETTEEVTLNERQLIMESGKEDEVPEEEMLNDDSSKQENNLIETEKPVSAIKISEVVELSESQTMQDEDVLTRSIKETSIIVELPEIMNNGIQDQSEFKTMSEPENSFNDKDAADSSENSNMESENIESSEVSQHVNDTNMDLSESLTTKVNEENSIAHEAIESSDNSECYNDGPETSEAKHGMKTDSTESITTNENEEETTNVQTSFINETVEATESQNAEHVATYETSQQKEFQNPPETYRMFETLKEANPKTERMRIPIPLCTPKSSKIVQAPNYTQNVVDSMHQQHREAEELSKAQELNESNDNCNQMEHQSDHTHVLNESNDNCNQMEHQTGPTNELIERKDVEQIIIPDVMSVMSENNNQVLNKIECAEQNIEENTIVEQKNIEEQSNNNDEPECSANISTLVIDNKMHKETTENEKEEDLLATKGSYSSNEMDKRSLNLEIIDNVPDKNESIIVNTVKVFEDPQEHMVVLENTKESSSVSSEQIESIKEKSQVVSDKTVLDEIKPREEKIVHISDELDEISSDDDREQSFEDCNRYDEDEDDRERSLTPPAVETVSKDTMLTNKNEVQAQANDLVINENISVASTTKIELVRESTQTRPTVEIEMKNDVLLPEINKSKFVAQKDDIVIAAEDVSDEESSEETSLSPEPIAPKVAQEIKINEPLLPIEIGASASIKFISEPEKKMLKKVVVEQQFKADEMLDLSKASKEVLKEKTIDSFVEVSPTKMETLQPMETTELAEDLTKHAEASKSIIVPTKVIQNLSPKKRMTLLPIANRKRKLSETRLPTESDSDSLSDRPSDSLSQDTEDDDEEVSKKKLKLRTKNPKKIVRKNAPSEMNESSDYKQEEKLIEIQKIDDIKPFVEPKIVQSPIDVANVVVVEQVKVEIASSSEKQERKPVRAAARKAMDEIKTLDKPATQTRQKRMQVEAKAEEVKAIAAALVKAAPVKVAAAQTKDVQIKVEEKPISPVEQEDVVVESKQRKAMSVQAKKEEEKKELLNTPVEPQQELKIESIESTDEKVPAATSSTKQDLKFDYDANEDVVANVAAIKYMMTKEVKTEDDEENDVSKKRGRKSKRGRYARKSNQNDGSSSDEDAPSNAKGAKQEEAASKTTTPKKKRETGPKGLLRHIDTSLVIDTNDETPVRMSRRIAQQKIREETDRRQMEEKLLKQMKAEAEKKKKGGPGSDNEKDENYEKEEEEEEEEEENSDEAGAKEGKKRKKTKILPSDKQWQTSSSASEESEQEEEDYMEHIPSDHGSPLFRSDHEFSPESDDETDQVIIPIKRARTAKKVVATEANSNYEDINPIHACQVCHKTDSPEWILLCDQCDHGYHCSCLTPIVFLIPSGNWFCPLCCHKNLVEKLSKQLIDYDSMMHAFKLEEMRKQRQSLAEISAENIIEESQEAHRKRERSDKYSEDRETSSKKKTSRAISYSSNESSGSSSDDEPLNFYKLRKRNQTAVPSYRFNDYDDLINSAIRKDMASKVDEDVEIDDGEDEDETHAGNAGRGKDIATIIEGDKEEKKEQDDETIKDVEESKGKKMERKDESSDDSDIVKPRKYKGKKKSRKLNNLDISSEEDRGSDEDFKGASSSDSDEAGTGSGDSESSLDFPRRKGKKGKSTRRSTRTRQKRVEERFIDDNTSDDEPLKPPARKIKKRTLSEEEEFDVNDDEDEDGSVDEEIDSEDLCDDTETSDSSNNGWPKKKKKRTASYDIKPVKKVVKRTDDEDKAFRAGISKKKILKESLKSDAEDDKEGSDGSESAKGKRKTRGKKLLYLIEDDLESSDDGIKPGVKRPDTPPEERELFIQKQEEIKRMLAAKNTEGAKQLAAPKITHGCPPSPPPLISGESSSLSTVPKQFIESAKALDLDYRIKPQSSMIGASKIDMNPNDMNEEELARMMEEEDFAQHQLKLAGEAIARKKLLDLETKVEENFAGFKDSNRKDKPEPKKRSKKQKVEVKPIPGSVPTSVIASLITATTAIPPIMESPSNSLMLTPHPSQHPPLQLLTTQTENLSRPNLPPLHSHLLVHGGTSPSTVSSAHHGPTPMPSQIFSANQLFAGIVPRHPSVISSHYPPTPEQLLPLSYHQPSNVHHPSQAHQLQQISPESDSKKRGRRKKFTPLRTDLPTGATSDVIRSDKSALPAATSIERMDEKVKGNIIKKNDKIVDIIFNL